MGFAIVNPGATDAAVTFNLYRADGGLESTTNQTIPARGQLAKLGNEFFPSAANTGWVQAASATSGLQGFWLAGDFLNFTDGAEAATSSPDLFLPIVTPQSEIHIANTGTASVTVLIRIFGEEGFELASPAVQVIPPKGFYKTEVSALFPRDINLTAATHLRLTCTNPFAATVIVRDFIAGPSWAVMNAVPPASIQTSLYFPHLVEGILGGANYKSVLGITNLSSNPNEVSITMTSEDGSNARTVTRTIAPNGALRETARSLFTLTDAFQTGWVRIAGTRSMTGWVAYADSGAGGVAIVPPQSEALTTLLFSHIADLDPWWTGLALLNTNSTAANIEIFALTPRGELIGGAVNIPTARVVLPPNVKIARLLNEWIPQTQSRTSDGGFVFVRSDVPLYGIELFFTRTLKILSNVAAGRIPPGITYVPPAPR